MSKFFMDIEELLDSAIKQALKRDASEIDRKNSEDYAARLAERALYRRLIDQCDLSQDGVRFVWWFQNREGRSLADWRRLIDREMDASHQKP